MGIVERFNETEQRYLKASKSHLTVKVFFAPLAEECFAAIKEAKRAFYKTKLYHSDPTKIQALEISMFNTIGQYSYVISKLTEYLGLTGEQIAERSKTDSLDVGIKAYQAKIKVLDYKISDFENVLKETEKSKDVALAEQTSIIIENLKVLQNALIASLTNITE